jgi:hypothetical protein
VGEGVLVIVFVCVKIVGEAVMDGEGVGDNVPVGVGVKLAVAVGFAASS